MIPEADRSFPPGAVGVDVGASLAKLAARYPSGALRFSLFPSQEIERAAREIEALAPGRVGVTGAGSERLARALGRSDTARVDEFEAWRAGASELLVQQGAGAPERDLLVSLGTGTSVLLVEPGRAIRVGGTALGGGTLLGLGAALLGTVDFAELVRLAQAGDRRRVDLLVADLEAGDAIPLPGDITAASLAKLATGAAAAPADVAHALFGMIGENVGLLAGALAAATGARRVVYGGGLLRANPPLRAILGRFAAFGPALVFLENGEFAGAVGALARAEAS